MKTIFEVIGIILFMIMASSNLPELVIDYILNYLKV